MKFEQCYRLFKGAYTDWRNLQLLFSTFIACILNYLLFVVYLQNVLSAFKNIVTYTVQYCNAAA